MQLYVFLVIFGFLRLLSLGMLVYIVIIVVVFFMYQLGFEYKLSDLREGRLIMMFDLFRRGVLLIV